MHFCIKVIDLRRSYTTNTQPIWKQQYPTGAWESQACSQYIFFYFVFSIDIVDNIITYTPYSPYDVTGTSANGSAVSLSHDTDGNLICIVQCLRFSGFIIYPLSFFLYSPFKIFDICPMCTQWHNSVVYFDTSPCNNILF